MADKNKTVGDHTALRGGPHGDTCTRCGEPVSSPVHYLIEPKDPAGCPPEAGRRQAAVYKTMLRAMGGGGQEGQRDPREFVLEWLEGVLVPGLDLPCNVMAAAPIQGLLQDNEKLLLVPQSRLKEVEGERDEAREDIAAIKAVAYEALNRDEANTG